MLDSSYVNTIDTEKLKEIAEIEFNNIVEDVILTDINELRIILLDGSYKYSP